MTTIVDEYNSLDNTTLTRDDIGDMIEEANEQGQYHIAKKLQSILYNNDDKRFELTVENKVKKFHNKKNEKDSREYGLNAEMLYGLSYAAPEEFEATGLGKPVSVDEIYDMITKKMVDHINKATGKGYVKKWKAKAYGEGFLKPINFVSKKPYRGINALLLKNFDPLLVLENPYFLTFNQIDKLGGKLKKGSKGREVVYFTILYKVGWIEDGENKEFGTYDKKKFIKFLKENNHVLKEIRTFLSLQEIAQQSTVPILKYYNVFALQDTTGIDFDLTDKSIPGRLIGEKLPPKEEIEAAEGIVKNYPTPKPKITHKGDKAFYTLGANKVTLPYQASFDAAQDYYRTLFHELTHCSGDPKHLNREMGGRFGSKKYAKEELIAEWGATYLSAEAGIMWVTNKNHAEYIKNWNNILTRAKDDNRFIMRAASAAQKAADYILDRDNDGVPAYRKSLESVVTQNEDKKTKSKSIKKTDWKTEFKKKNGIKFEKALHLLREGIVDIPEASQPLNEITKDVFLALYKHNIKTKKINVGDENKFDIDIDKLKPYAKSPKSRKFGIESLKKIVGRDEMRPNFMGVYVDKKGYVATDAHKLVFLKSKTKKENQDKILNTFLKISGHNEKYIDAKYPNWKAVMPEYTASQKGEWFSIESSKKMRSLLDKVYSAIKLFKPLRKSEEPIIVLDNKVSFNLRYFYDVLFVLVANDAKKIRFGKDFKKKHSPLLIETDNGNKALLMPYITKSGLDHFEVHKNKGAHLPKPPKGSKKGLSMPQFETGQLGLFGLSATAQNQDTIKFNKAILKAKKEGIDPGKTFNLGKTKGNLKKYTVDGNITLSGSVVKKIMSGKDKAHSLTWDNLINLPDYINNPFAIFDSSTVKDSFVVLVEIKNNLEKPVMVAIKLHRKNGKDRKVNVMDIRSVYSKRTKKVYRDWRNEGKLIYGNEKSDFFKPTMGPIPTRQKKSLSKDNKDTKTKPKTTKKTKNQGLKSPTTDIIKKKALETVVEVAKDNLKNKTKSKKVRNIAAAGQAAAEYYTVPGAVGQFFQAVERKPHHSVVITLDGHQGSGKTTFLYSIMNAFAAGHNRGVFFSLEEHPDSALAIEKAQKYIAPENKQYIDVVGDIDEKKEFFDIIDQYDIVYLDSWQKLIRAIGNIKLDEDLRKKFDGKVFIIIFQQTTTGRTKGGSEVVFDGDIITKLVKEDKFADNYAYFDKNRYTRVPLESVRYNIAGGYVYDPSKPNKESKDPVDVTKNTATTVKAVPID